MKKRKSRVSVAIAREKRCDRNGMDAIAWINGCDRMGRKLSFTRTLLFWKLYFKWDFILSNWATNFVGLFSYLKGGLLVSDISIRPIIQ